RARTTAALMMTGMVSPITSSSRRTDAREGCRRVLGVAAGCRALAAAGPGDGRVDGDAVPWSPAGGQEPDWPACPGLDGRPAEGISRICPGEIRAGRQG